jgi:RNA polymerase sigma-70 factor (ECF subfamily)
MVLGASLLAHASHAVREQLRDAAGLEEALARIWAAARSRWPDVSLEPEAFMRHIAERLPAEGGAEEALASLHAADLYLAAACLSRDPAALAAFEREHLAPLSRYLESRDALPAFADEVKQAVRTRVLLPEGGALARLATYTGRGALGAWLRMTATRLAIDLRRAEGRGAAGGDADAQVAPVATDPEIAYFSRHYGEAFRAAFESSLQALSTREATIVRLYFLEEMTAADIARTFRASERSVRRWVREARAKILLETRKALGQNLDISGTQLDSIVRFVQGGPAARLVGLLKLGDE